MSSAFKTFVIVIIAVVVVIGIIVLYDAGRQRNFVTNFDECAEAGFQILESFPRQCKTPYGENFIEEIGNEKEKENLIRVDFPRPNDTITSPVVVRGQARGNWYFEASFPITIMDMNQKIVGQGIATAEDEWMTTDFVPFKGQIDFKAVTTEKGLIIFHKDNPSGDTKFDDELRVPVRFNTATTTALQSCRPTGCSGQICSDEDVVTSCEFKPEYACYKIAKCERQQSGECGWTESASLKACIRAAN